MRKLLLPSLALATCLCAQSAFAAVGFINYAFTPGYNVFGNQLDSGDNHANNILLTAPVGTALTEWDPIASHCLPYSIFNGATWSINYNLALGQGAVLFTSASFTNTFVGSVLFATNALPANGLFLASSILPFSGAGFSDVTGRAPLPGESVTQFAGVFSKKTFDGIGWVDPGNNPVSAPSLGVMQAAFFGLGTSGGVLPPLPPPVPEPGTGVLLLASAAVFKLIFGRRKG